MTLSLSHSFHQLLYTVLCNIKYFWEFLLVIFECESTVLIIVTSFIHIIYIDNVSDVQDNDNQTDAYKPLAQNVYESRLSSSLYT